MLRGKQTILASVLLLALTGPAIAGAESSVPPIGSQVNEQTHNEQHDGVQKHRHAPFQIGPHRRMYLTLLAEKYLPESVGEWQALFTERERIVRRWQDLHRKLLERKQKDRVVGQQKEGGHRHHRFAAWKQAHAAIYDEFTQAIESRDAARIKTVLPKLLNEMKAANKHLAEKANELEKKIGG